MPTPNHELTLSSPGLDSHVHWAHQHTSCPPDGPRLETWGRRSPEGTGTETQDTTEPDRTPEQAATTTVLDGPADAVDGPIKSNKVEVVAEDGPLLSPVSTISDVKDSESHLSPCRVASSTVTHSPSSSMSHEFSNVRLLPTSSSSFLRAGSKFNGTQQSDRQVYDVQVELNHVDMSQSFLCGYLRIQGLTDDHPTLTTYFEGEIIGDKYSFQTKHPDWGSNDKVDMQHWARFHAWRPLAKSAKKPDFSHKNFAQRENIFMRWKEHFLVPDHRVRTISGASFEGFYYICFNQVSGNISGIYFHAKSEKYQQLELTHVEDRGCYGAMEFR